MVAGSAGVVLTVGGVWKDVDKTFFLSGISQNFIIITVKNRHCKGDDVPVSTVELFKAIMSNQGKASNLKEGDFFCSSIIGFNCLCLLNFGSNCLCLRDLALLPSCYLHPLRPSEFSLNPSSLRETKTVVSTTGFNLPKYVFPSKNLDLNTSVCQIFVTLFLLTKLTNFEVLLKFRELKLLEDFPSVWVTNK